MHLRRQNGPKMAPKLIQNGPKIVRSGGRALAILVFEPVPPAGPPDGLQRAPSGLPTLCHATRPYFRARAREQKRTMMYVLRINSICEKTKNDQIKINSELKKRTTPSKAAVIINLIEKRKTTSSEMIDY